MADTTLKFILETTFKGSGIKDASGGLKDLTSQASQADKALVKTGDGFVSLGGAARNASAFMSGLGISTDIAINPMYALGSAIKFAIGEAAEAEKIMAQTEAVIKSTGGAAGLTAQEISGIAGALSEVSTFSDDTIQKGQNLLLTFTGIGKDVFPEATKVMLDMATAMGTDASAGAIQLGKALNDPTAGITALTRVGVVFTAEQKRLIKSLQDTGDIAGAQRVILAELNKEFGGSAAAAASTYSGKLEVLKNKVFNLAEEMGGHLLPAAEGVVDMMTGRVDAFNLLNKAFQSGAINAGEYASTLFTLTTFGPDASQEIEFLNQKLKEQATLLEEQTQAMEDSIDAHDRMAASTDVNVAGSAEFELQTLALTSAWQSYGPSVSAAAAANEELRQTLDPLTGAASDLKFGMGELTTATLFHQAAQGLDADASYALAESMGMINKDSAAAKSILDDLRKQLEDGTITTAEYTTKVGLLNAAINSLPDGKVITIEMLQEYTQQFNAEFSGQGGTEDGHVGGATGDGYDDSTDAQGATGLHMAVPPGYPDDSFRVGVQSGEMVDVWRSPTERAAAFGGGTTIVNNIYDQRAMAMVLEQQRRMDVERAESLMG